MNIDKIRNESPSCEEQLFVNSAGASIPPSIVTKTIIDYLKKEEQVGGYKLMDIEKENLEEFYNISAQLIHAEPRNMAFASSATDAFGKALSAIPFQNGDIILTTDNDYVSNHIQYNSLKERFDIQVKRIRSLANGDLDIEHMEALINERQPRLCAISHIPTNSGLVQDAEAVGRVCKKYEVLYLLDACQSVGQMDVNVDKIGCQLLSMTGRKFMRAPRGTGFLYVADELLDQDFSPLVMDSFGCSWHSTNGFSPSPTAKRFELWEKSDALKLGMKEAIRYALQVGMDNIEDYNSMIRERLISNLDSITGVELYDLGSQRANIITLRKASVGREQFCLALDKAEVKYSITSKESAFIDFDKKGIDWAIRLSPHYFNTLSEMDRLSEIIASI